MNIKEIASLAGVSVSTISKVMNKKDQDISAETRKKVLDIVKKYQYIPYTKIIESTKIRSNLIALMIENEQAETQNPLIWQIEKYAAEKGYSVLLTRIGKTECEKRRNMSILAGKKIEAAIILSQESDLWMSKEYTDKKIPVIYLRTQTISSVAEELTVGVERESIGYDITKYLLEKGHTKINCILAESDESFLKGYVKALYENGQRYDALRILGESVLAEEDQNWCLEDCTAIVCSREKLAVRLYKILTDYGLSIPKDISVLSAEDSGLAQFLSPALTGVCVEWDQVAFDLVDRVVSILEYPEFKAKKYKKKYFSLIERGSTAEPPVYKRGQKIIVVGSMNMDVNISLPKIPVDGENMTASAVSLLPGGKGANQAVGIGRLGGNVYAIGCLGNDAAAKELYGSLVENHVKTDGIVFDKTIATGKAYINVANDGSSTIVIYHGANDKLDLWQLQQQECLFADAGYCLLSTEIPLETVGGVIEICKKNKVKLMVKPAGISQFPVKWLAGIDFFIPSIKELELLIPGNEAMEEKAEKLLKSGVRNVLVTLGGDGCYLRTPEESRFFPAAHVNPVDMTGGADAFISTLALYLSEGAELVKAIGFATYSAGICIAGQGVQPVLPQRGALDVYKDQVEKNFKTKISNGGE